MRNQNVSCVSHPHSLLPTGMLSAKRRPRPQVPYFFYWNRPLGAPDEVIRLTVSDDKRPVWGRCLTFETWTRELQDFRTDICELEIEMRVAVESLVWKQILNVLQLYMQARRLEKLSFTLWNLKDDTAASSTGLIMVDQAVEVYRLFQSRSTMDALDVELFLGQSGPLSVIELDSIRSSFQHQRLTRLVVVAACHSNAVMSLAFLQEMVDCLSFLQHLEISGCSVAVDSTCDHHLHELASIFQSSMSLERISLDLKWKAPTMMSTTTNASVSRTCNQTSPFPISDSAASTRKAVMPCSLLAFHLASNYFRRTAEASPSLAPAIDVVTSWYCI